MLTGPPGVGKTTLMRWLSVRTAASGAICASARAPANAGLPPLFPIGDLVAGMRRSCGRLRVAEPDSLIDLDLSLAGGGSLEKAGVLPLAACVNDLLRRAPVALFLDDAHWVPAAAIAALAGVLHLCDGRLLVAATSRSRSREHRTHPFADLPGDVARTQVAVEPMDPAGIEVLAASILGGPVLPSTAHTLHRLSRGVPLEAAEIIRAWGAAGTLHRSGGYWAVEAGGALAHADLFASRLAALGDEDRHIIEMLAVIGRESSFECLREVLDAEPVKLGVRLGRLIEEGIVAEADRLAYSLAHPLYEASVVSSLGPTRKATLHLAAYAGLERLRERGETVPAPVLAHHAVSSITRPPRVHDLLAQAAQESATGDARDHARWLEELERLAEAGPARADAALRRAEATLAFDPATARALFEALLAQSPPAGMDPRCRIGLAKAERRLGHLDRAVAHARDAVGSAPGDADALGTLALMLGVSGDLTRSADLLDRAVSADAGAATRFANYRAMVAFLDGRLDDAVRIAETHAADADPEQRGNLLSNLGWFRAIDGRLDEAVEPLERSLEVATRGSALFAVFSTRCDLAIVHAWRGAHAAALDHAVQAERLVALIGEEEGSRFELLDAFGALHLEAGEPEAALAHLEQAAGLVQGISGPYEQAFTIANYAEAQRATGDPKTALATLAAAEAGNVVPPYWRVNLGRVRSACLVDLGRPDEAVACLETVTTQRRPAFEVALAHLVLSDAHRAAGRRDAAAAAAAEAAGGFERIGASHRLGQAQAKLAVLTRRRGRPKSPAVAGLTQREQDVVKLVREALTNRQIAEKLGISERTVEKHVANACLKAGVHRRGQLASFATARGL